MTAGPASAAPVPIEVTLFALDDDRAMPLALARTWLGDEESTRAASFRFEIHRDRYIRGRGMMRGLLGRRLGVDPASLVFSLGEKGKPRLPHHRIGFNLSHSEGIAAFALGEVADLGIDIERYDRTVDLEGLARRCFREPEIAWMHSFPEQDRHRAFFRIWTAKEARMKATGEGFSLEPKRIALTFDDGHPVRCHEPTDPAAHLATLPLPDAACTVAALVPIRATATEPPAWV